MASPSPAVTGAAIRKLRMAKGWTLQQLAEACGVPVSSLSRVELGQSRLNYDKLVRLCRALDVDLHGLVAREADAGPPVLGRRALTPGGQGDATRFGPHAARRPAADLLGKAFTPVMLDVQPSSLEEHGPLQELGGEAWLLVLEGRVRVHGGVYAPTELAAGDSLYFDARAGFAVLRADAAPARALLVVDGRGG
ncbi:helix-turn-helix domain-containing protein [Caulobacter sp. KR2-114]|uniref:helix-turn-helix domain-containing protein n=1 Tax=Caulobacter sp. KR2-114 TaxID=3400912 RepID=UPI003BFD967B